MREDTFKLYKNLQKPSHNDRSPDLRAYFNFVMESAQRNYLQKETEN
jgi:hypothetical protein